MAYTPAGRGDNSILSQVMKYDKSVQPAQSYTNVAQQYTPFGRMEDWETLAKGLGRGIGMAGKKAYGYGKQKYGEYKEGQAAAEKEQIAAKKAERDAWREKYIQAAKARKEGYDLEDRQLEGRLEESRENFMRGQDLLREEFPEEDVAASRQYHFEAEEAPRREPQVDPVTGEPPPFREDAQSYNPYNLPGPPNVPPAGALPSGTFGGPGYVSKTPRMSGATLQRGMEELRRNPSYLASLSPKERAGLTGELDPVTGLPLSTAELRKSKDPKFYNKWKMKMKRFLEKEFGKEAPVDLQSLTPIQQRLQQLQMKSKKPSKKGTNYPSGTYTRGTY